MSHRSAEVESSLNICIHDVDTTRTGEVSAEVNKTRSSVVSSNPQNNNSLDMFAGTSLSAFIPDDPEADAAFQEEVRKAQDENRDRQSLLLERRNNMILGFGQIDARRLNTKWQGNMTPRPEDSEHVDALVAKLNLDDRRAVLNNALWVIIRSNQWEKTIAFTAEHMHVSLEEYKARVSTSSQLYSAAQSDLGQRATLEDLPAIIFPPQFGVNNPGPTEQTGFPELAAGKHCRSAVIRLAEKNFELGYHAFSLLEPPNSKVFANCIKHLGFSAVFLNADEIYKPENIDVLIEVRANKAHTYKSNGLGDLFDAIWSSWSGLPLEKRAAMLHNPDGARYEKFFVWVSSHLAGREITGAERQAITFTLKQNWFLDFITEWTSMAVGREDLTINPINCLQKSKLEGIWRPFLKSVLGYYKLLFRDCHRLATATDVRFINATLSYPRLDVYQAQEHDSRELAQSAESRNLTALRNLFFPCEGNEELEGVPEMTPQEWTKLEASIATDTSMIDSLGDVEKRRVGFLKDLTDRQYIAVYSSLSKKTDVTKALFTNKEFATKANVGQFVSEVCEIVHGFFSTPKKKLSNNSVERQNQNWVQDITDVAFDACQDEIHEKVLEYDQRRKQEVAELIKEFFNIVEVRRVHSLKASAIPKDLKADPSWVGTLNNDFIESYITQLKSRSWLLECFKAAFKVLHGRRAVGLGAVFYEAHMRGWSEFESKAKDSQARKLIGRQLASMYKSHTATRTAVPAASVKDWLPGMAFLIESVCCVAEHHHIGKRLLLARECHRDVDCRLSNKARPQHKEYPETKEQFNKEEADWHRLGAQLCEAGLWTTTSFEELTLDYFKTSKFGYSIKEWVDGQNVTFDMRLPATGTEQGELSLSALYTPPPGAADVDQAQKAKGRNDSKAKRRGGRVVGSTNGDAKRKVNPMDMESSDGAQTPSKRPWVSLAPTTSARHGN